MSWLSPVLAVELPAVQRERIFPKMTLGQCRFSVDVVEAVIEATKRNEIKGTASKKEVLESCRGDTYF